MPSSSTPGWVRGKGVSPSVGENCENKTKATITVKLELNPEIEAGLMAQAQARGLSLEDYVAQVLQSAADVFITREGDKWVLKKSIRESASEVFPTQAEAIEHARKLGASTDTQIERLRVGRKSLAQLFAESPFKGLDLKFERDADTGRPVKL